MLRIISITKLIAKRTISLDKQDDDVYHHEDQIFHEFI
jgi:hypothetical protein